MGRQIIITCTLRDGDVIKLLEQLFASTTVPRVAAAPELGSEPTNAIMSALIDNVLCRYNETRLGSMEIFFQ